MNHQTETLQTVFTKNRTEELGYDVWKNFVVPPFYDSLDLYRARKPRVIVGGRGCGKTMLLRYLAHQSTFSRDRPSIPEGATTHIGLYWRSDTQFARLMIGRGIAEDVWSSAFHHLLALVLGTQLLQSLKSIARSKSSALNEDELLSIRFQRLAAFDAAFDQTVDCLLGILEDRLHGFEMWVANVRKQAEPIFLPGAKFLSAMIGAIKDQVATLQEATYYVYLDEYENLQEYQQRIVNTYLKHSEMPLIFNIAVKRNGFSTRKTVSEESISDIADYRTHDLEKYLLEGNFSLFAAEVLFLNLAMAKVGEVPIDPRVLRDVHSLESRRDRLYRDKVLASARVLFPGEAPDELARSVFDEPSLSNRLHERVREALKAWKSDLPVEKFLRPGVPKASITASGLLYRSKPTPEEVCTELDHLERGEENKFTGRTNWIHNNFVGCLLSIYGSHWRACPFYAGFATFCQMARGNLRHFLELCHKSINRLPRTTWEAPLQVPPGEQALAARQTSAAFLGEIRSFGHFGNQLHNFVLRLGSLFAMSHRSPAQSEPERSHFAIVRGRQSLTEADMVFLREAVKWSVLFEEEETKVKDPMQQPGSYEYVLNPIYAAYFGITYRKRRKLDLSYEDFRTLRAGAYNDVRALLQRYAKALAIDLPAADSTLFSHLVEDVE